ncbi:MAG: phytanoyl-CoA dioxygenase family protein [Ilumatobacteraceae bacterium]|nr:phytanoyl-CoA dioxygenase family protein [Ilumatobacteraceae bacterium]
MDAEGTGGHPVEPPPLRPRGTIRGRHLVERSLVGRRAYRRSQLVADPVAHRDLAVHGYHAGPVILDEGARASLRSAMDAWLAASPPAGGGFRSSFEPEPTPAGRHARKSVIEHLVPAVAALVTPEAVVGPSVFQCKPPGPEGRLSAHQDAFVVDEREDYGLHAWVALSDITLRDGPLFVLPGSHRYATWTRISSPGDEFGTLHGAIERHARVLEVRAGQVVWFDHATIHGSLENQGNDLRAAVSAFVVPSRRQLTIPIPSTVSDPRCVDVLGIDARDVCADLSTLRLDNIIEQVQLDLLCFGPRSVGLTARLHAALHRSAPGVPIPAGLRSGARR